VILRKRLATTLQGWLPKEDKLSGFRKVTAHDIVKNQPIRQQAEKELCKAIDKEIKYFERADYYLALAIYMALIVGWVYVFFISSFLQGYGFGYGLGAWIIFNIGIGGYPAVMREKFKMKIDKALKQGLIQGSQSLLEYHEKSYLAQKKYSLLSSLSCLVLFCYWAAGALLKLWVPDNLQYAMFSAVLVFGVAMLAVIPWDRRTTEKKKNKIQNLLSQIEKTGAA